MQIRFDAGGPLCTAASLVVQFTVVSCFVDKMTESRQKETNNREFWLLIASFLRGASDLNMDINLVTATESRYRRFTSRETSRERFGSRSESSAFKGIVWLYILLYGLSDTVVQR